MANPFQFGRAVAGERFTDREGPLRVISSCMREGQNVILMSPRRYGKTSLLKVAVEAMTAGGGRAAMVDLQLCADRRMVAEELRRALLPLSEGWIHRRLDEWRKMVTRHVPYLVIGLEHDGYSTTFRPMGREYDWGDAIASLIGLMAELGTRREPIALVIDEFQKVTSIDRDLAGLFKGIVDRTQGLSLVFSGSRRHLMEDLFSDEGAPLKGTGMTVALDLIPRADMVSFLMQRAAGAGKMLAEDVAGLIYDSAHGVPNTVQLFAFWAFQEGRRRVDTAAVHRGINLAVDAVAPELASTYLELSSVQQRLVLALAAAGAVAHPFEGRFVAEVGVDQAASVQKALRRLEQAEIAWPTPAGWQLVNAAFERWLLRDRVP
ncbi:MAG: ATP-binding protein [Candidatus Dormibacteria bacterium]